MGQGRPSKLTPEMQETIVGYIKDDNVPLDIAAAAVGITHRSLQYWMRWGEDQDDAWQGEQEPEPGTYASFFREVRRARALSTIDAIKDAVRGDSAGVGNGKSKCAQWYLERQAGKSFQPKIQIKVEEETAVLLDVLEAVLPLEQCAAVMAAIEDVDDNGIPRVLSMSADELAARVEH